MPDSYPSARAAVDEILNGHQVGQNDAHSLKVYYHLTGDYLNELPGTVPVLVYRLGGTEDSGYDRTERIGVDVYAHGSHTEQIAEIIRGLLVNDGEPHDLTAGYIDRISVETLPSEVPYPTAPITHAQGVYRVTSRPA